MFQSTTIFDSRVASKVYEDKSYPYYRSADFTVGAGQVAILELTTSYNNICKVCFAAYRKIGAPICDGLDNRGLGKLYRRLGCDGKLGMPGENSEGGTTQYTQYNRSVLRLGHDLLNDTVVEFDCIDRPGDYYLLADKECCDDNVITDCDNPTIIEVTIAPLAFSKMNPCVDYSQT